MRALLALAALLALLPSAAVAQSPGSETNAPPGNSAIDEYLETVPAAGGDRRPRASGEAGGGLAPARRQKLEQRGPDGEVLAALVDSTAPAAARAGSAGAGGSRPASGGERRAPPAGDTGDTAAAGAAAVAPARDDARSPLQATLAAAVGPNDGVGMGLLLPLVLVASALGVLGLAVRRRRSGP